MLRLRAHRHHADPAHAPDGSGQEQITSDDFNNWFPYISPDGKWMVFLTYEKEVSGHPENKNVRLRLMSLEDKKISTIASLFGGQGAINVPSWSPDKSNSPSSATS